VKRGLYAVVVATAFLTMLDNTVVTVAAPSIARDLGAALPRLEWVTNGYMLAYAGLLLPGGRLADRLGDRRVLLGGLALFTAASLAAGLAQHLDVLIAARAVQGAGAALLVPATLAVVATRGEADRMRLAAAWTASGAVALAAGPVVGGALSQHLGWSWIFLLNVPVGMAALAIGARSLDAKRRFATRGGRPPGGRVFLGAVAVQVLWGLGVTGVYFHTAVFLQDVRGLTPVAAGLVFLPVAAAVVLGAPAAGPLVRSRGAARTIAAGLLLVGGGIGAVGLRSGSTPVLLAALAVIGFGSALTVPLAAVAVAAVPPERAGIAAGVFAVAREGSGVLGVAGVGAVITAGGGYPLGVAAAAVLVLAGAAIAGRTLPGPQRADHGRPGSVQLTLPVRPGVRPVQVEVDGGRDAGQQ